MKLRSLQYITLAVGLATVAGSILAMDAMRRPALDVMHRPVTPWVPPDEVPQPSTDVASPFTSTQALLERPLFQPDRRPFQPPPPLEQVMPPVAIVVEPPPSPPVVIETAAPPPAPVPSPPLNATLKGVLLTDALDEAYLVYPASPNGAWVTVGTEIDGWKLTRIAKDQVTLVLGEQKQVLQLYVDNPAMPVGNAAPAN